LGRFPYSGHAVFDNDDSFREICHDKYRIFYSVAEGSIFISRIWHGARRRPWEPELDDE
jgi:plasmid stabilization system protein ParE